MFKRVGRVISEMTKQKKLFNRKGDSVEIKEDGRSHCHSSIYDEGRANDVSYAGQL